jgi:hypothetical protein
MRSPGFQSGALTRTSVSHVPSSASSLNTGTWLLLPGAGRRAKPTAATRRNGPEGPAPHKQRAT